MGLIAQRVAEFTGELRNDTGWLNRDDDGSYGPMTPAGVSVDKSAALTITAFWRCVDILASAAAFAPKDLYLKVGGRSFPEFTRPSWMVTPDPRNPTLTIDDYFLQVATSLLIDGNYYTLAVPSVFDPQLLQVLDPSRVVPKPMGQYEILDERGRVRQTVGAMQMLHGRLFELPGSLKGLSPLEKFRRSLGSAIAAEDFAARFFGQGAALSFGVEVPYAMDPEKLQGLRDSLKAKYVGLRNSHAIGVLADGGKFVTGLAPTPEQAQMLETRKFAVEDIARIFGIPPGMLGSQEPGASSYASAETWKDTYKEITLYPLIARIEKQHSRLLQVPDSVADPTASMQFKVNLDAYLRMDAKTRFETYEVGVRSGVLTPNYARDKEDLAPLDGGDQLYMQAQMVPLPALAKQQAAPAATPTPEAAA